MPVSFRHFRGIRQTADLNAAEFSLEALPCVLDLQRRYHGEAHFPGKAASFLKQIANKFQNEKITRENILHEFEAKSGMRVAFLDDHAKLDRGEIIEKICEGVIGQMAAIEAAADVISIAKSRLNDTSRPIASFLFLGGRGVGKTELAKSLARFFFGAADEKEKIVRLDMSEYNLAGAAWRLLMKTDGEPSDLIQRVRDKPFSVVLFDEIEKADAQVFDVLLGLFDEGRLTDRFGRVTNFTSTVVIMTSNLGAERFARGEIGFSESEIFSGEKEIKAFFRPEFFNRLDGVVQFQPLDKTSLYKITEKEIFRHFQTRRFGGKRCQTRLESSSYRTFGKKRF